MFENRVQASYGFKIKAQEARLFLGSRYNQANDPMDDIHPFKEFLPPMLGLAPEFLVLAIMAFTISIAAFSYALSRWRPVPLEAPDIVPVSDIRAEMLAEMAAVPLESDDFAALTHTLARHYLDRIRPHVPYSTRTGREITAMLDDDRIRKLEEMYTASQYADVPLDHESRRRFRRLAEEIVLGIG
ncbi:MAG TPA: hypothetical protein PK765_02140 [bacterium]|nr:hypothetical protein [bacterium]